MLVASSFPNILLSLWLELKAGFPHNKSNFDNKVKRKTNWLVPSNTFESILFNNLGEMWFRGKLKIQPFLYFNDLDEYMIISRP